MIVAATGPVNMPLMIMAMMFVMMMFVTVIVGMRMIMRMAVAVMVVPLVIMPLVIMVMVIMAVMVMPVIVTAGAVVVGGALGAEGAGDRGREAALSADQLGRGRRRRDEQDVRGDLGGHVAAAELPGQPHQPGGVLGAHLQEILRGGAHGHEPPVIETQGVAILQGRGFVERHREGQAALGDQGTRGRGPSRVVEAHRVGDLVGAHRGPADDGGGGRR